MARKGAKSRTRITGLRSKTTKARTHVDRLRAANADLKKKLAEALELEAATSEILRVIRASLADIQPVLDVIVRNAARLCEAEYVDLLLRDGDVLKLAASHGSLPTAAETRPIRRTLVSGRVIMDGRPLHISDLQAELDEFPDVPRRPGITIRTLLCVPLMREGGRHRCPADSSHGGTAIYGQANFARPDLRHAGRHRHREHAPAQRAARIPATANLHRRHVEGHQPLNLRSQSRTRYADRIGGAPVRGGYREYLAT